MKPAIALLTTALLLTLLASVSSFAAGQPQRFRAGAATSNVTPPLGTSMNGNFAEGHATHVHDELNARCLVLDDGTTKLAIAVCDNTLIPREVHGHRHSHRKHPHLGDPLAFVRLGRVRLRR